MEKGALWKLIRDNLFFILSLRKPIRVNGNSNDSHLDLFDVVNIIVQFFTAKQQNGH